ncbi:conserved protein of unknown function (plasmid) [Rhodovastum atsumiense]|uniref:Uncharacterized protein n=1 Tax=Rhodovastum atsumiense TaxID=504468 RepID=A0A5M6IHW9_9PROT|nr:hypothetical protein [Rhodovastum atsumiense]KAA5607870.1 hypothetical protein F1189_31735 [Rhodovastum atsumiense]CAH2605760.1 conserved protein of unknown function [Rhodovastum atsumiense]CAH2605943.1 conserved protein of unknown function [Rhodovastum atsumiense]
MAAKSQNKSTAPRTTFRQEAPTFEKARMLAPTEAQAEKISAAYALDPVDYTGIREATRDSITRLAEVLVLNEVALKIHLQRLVGAHVVSAVRAGEFYSERVTRARELTTGNDDRDDRDGPAGFESRAARARQFAAEAALQARALLGAADGAQAAYEHLTGEQWKPYEGIAAPVSRQVAAAELDAFT